MLGPVRDFGQHSLHSFVQCSPILARPKRQSKRLSILDLSYPRGLALNDQADKIRFDDDLVSFRFSSIDDIVKEICGHKNDVIFLSWLEHFRISAWT